MDVKALKIGVLLGGMSGEREVSLRSGESCYHALLSLGYRVVKIDAQRDLAARLIEEGVELAFLALHGQFGEDGTVQGMLELMGIPYTGSGVLASALAMQKVACKKVVLRSGVPTPDFYEIGDGEPSSAAAAAIQAGLGLPVMLKPVEGGSSLGVSKCKTPYELEAAIRLGRPQYGTLFAERFVEGTEITIGVLEQPHGVIALPILELVPCNEFYDYESKYTDGMTEFILPARLEPHVYERAQAMAVDVFRATYCRGYARVDAMVARDGTSYFTEVNTLPGMTDLSDLPAQAREAGISYEELVETILMTAVRRS
jgi:D-alanine-D-alanine ligase